MKKLNNNKKKIILIVLALFSIVAITIGITYAFFNYAKEGTTDNTITSGTIEFLYTENPIAGRGIALTDAMPMSDSDGINLHGEGNEFNFTITSKTPSKIAIPYEITARRELEVNNSDNLDPSVVRIYLAKVETGLEDQEVLLENFNKLKTPTKEGLDTTVERLLYTGKVPSSNPNYEQHFKLKMWIDSKTDFSPIVDGNNITYPYNNKKFTIKVNVYSHGDVLTDTEVANETKAEIKDIYLGNKEDDVKFTKVTGQQYQYETTLPEGTTEAKIEVDTIYEDAKVTIEKLDSLAINELPKIERLSKKETLSLTPGDNYFKVTVKSIKDDDIKSEYKINIKVESVLLKSLSLTGCSISFNPNIDNYTCTVPGTVKTTTVTATPLTLGTQIEGIGSKTLETGANTINITLTTSTNTKTYTVVVTKEQIKTADVIKDGKAIVGTTPGSTAGLYQSTYTENGVSKTSFYFRGNVTNNYLDFAGFTWRVVRINDDGTIRIVLDSSFGPYIVQPSDNQEHYSKMYYSNWSDSSTNYVKGALKNWYQTNIINKNLGGYVASGNYFCEQFKVSTRMNQVENVTPTHAANYTTPTFACENDANGYGKVSGSYGLLTYDEFLMSGGLYNNQTSNFSLGNNSTVLMSPREYRSDYINCWYVGNGKIYNNELYAGYANSNVRPVINLKADTPLTGTGASDNHWQVQ